MIRRINLLGGPGCGKSTNAAELFAQLKRDGYSVELITEYVKGWAFEKRKIYPYDQIYFFGKQMKREFTALNAGVTFIITDSPLLLQIAYGDRAGLPTHTIDGMADILADYERKYPSLNIFLNRGSKVYKAEGRYEDREQAKKMDKLVKHLMSCWGVTYYELDWDKPDQIHALVMKYIKEAEENEC